MKHFSRTVLLLLLAVTLAILPALPATALAETLAVAKAALESEITPDWQLSLLSDIASRKL